MSQTSSVLPSNFIKESYGKQENDMEKLQVTTRREQVHRGELMGKCGRHGV